MTTTPELKVTYKDLWETLRSHVEAAAEAPSRADAHALLVTMHRLEGYLTKPAAVEPKLAACLVCNGTIQHTSKTFTGWEHENGVPFEHDAEPRLDDVTTA